MAEETVFFQEGNATVTSARVMLNGATYAMSNITSVKATVLYPKTSMELLGMCLGVLIAGFGLIPPFSVNAIVWGVGIAGVAFLIFRSKSKQFVVRLATSGGEVDAIKSDKADVIDRIVAAINAAMVHRG